MKLVANFSANDAAAIAAHNFLNTVNKTNPAAYKIIMGNINAINPFNLMAGLGEKLTDNSTSSGGLWNGILTGISEVSNIAFDLYKDKKIAEEQQEMLQQQARAALEAENIRLQQLQSRQQSVATQVDIARQQSEIQKIMDNVQFNKWQKIGLWTAGGLIGLLVINRLFLKIF